MKFDKKLAAKFAGQAMSGKIIDCPCMENLACKDKATFSNCRTGTPTPCCKACGEYAWKRTVEKKHAKLEKREPRF